MSSNLQSLFTKIYNGVTDLRAVRYPNGATELKRIGALAVGDALAALPSTQIGGEDQLKLLRNLVLPRAAPDDSSAVKALLVRLEAPNVLTPLHREKIEQLLTKVLSGEFTPPPLPPPLMDIGNRPKRESAGKKRTLVT